MEFKAGILQNLSYKIFRMIKRNDTLFTILTLLSLLAIFKLWRCRNPPPPCHIEDCFRQDIDALNKRLTYTQVVKRNAPLVCGSDQSAIYEIALKDSILFSTYFFNAYEYWIETGGNVKGDLCQFIRSVQEKKQDKILDIIKKLELEVNFSVFKLGGLQHILAEIYAVLGTLGQKYEIEIYVKGYADGYQTEWKKPLYRKPYDYHLLKYYPTTEPQGSLNPIRYDRNHPKDYKIDGNDLPFLRGQFIKQDFIDPFVKVCAKKVQKTYLLEGHEFSKSTIDSLQRKVQIFVAACR
jgi:hypothetical protein